MRDIEQSKNSPSGGPGGPPEGQTPHCTESAIPFRNPYLMVRLGEAAGMPPAARVALVGCFRPFPVTKRGEQVGRVLAVAWTGPGNTLLIGCVEDQTGAIRDAWQNGIPFDVEIEVAGKAPMLVKVEVGSLIALPGE